MRAKRVVRAEAWKWSSLFLRQIGDERAATMLHPWPIAVPRNWARLVNEPLTKAELVAIRQSVVRGSPYGSEAWMRRTARRLELESSMRPLGRPRKHPPANADQG